MIIKHYKILLWSIFIGILCFMPGNEFREVKINIPHFDKIVHFGMFYILGLLLQANKSINHKQFLGLVFIALFYAGVIEVIQYKYIYMRTGDFIDFISDIIGLFAGIFTLRYYPKFIVKLLQ